MKVCFTFLKQIYFPSFKNKDAQCPYKRRFKHVRQKRKFNDKKREIKTRVRKMSKLKKKFRQNKKRRFPKEGEIKIKLNTNTFKL